MTRQTPVRNTPADRNGLARVGRIGLRMLAAAAIIAGSTAITGLTDSTPAFAVDEVCPDGGVTVVVDSSDLGGEVEVACAEGAQESGRTALIAAGFTTTDSQPGFLCAINSRPDPCPETFDGSNWAYWYGNADGEWESYQMGVDSSTPALGGVEGWRYNDGATPPGLTPIAAVSVFADPTPKPAPSKTPDVAVPLDDNADSGQTDALTSEELQAEQNTVLTVVTIGFVVVVVALVVGFIARGRRNRPGSGGPGTGSSTPGEAPSGGTGAGSSGTVD